MLRQALPQRCVRTRFQRMCANPDDPRPIPCIGTCLAGLEKEVNSPIGPYHSPVAVRQDALTSECALQGRAGRRSVGDQRVDHTYAFSANSTALRSASLPSAHPPLALADVSQQSRTRGIAARKNHDTGQHLASARPSAVIRAAPTSGVRLPHRVECHLGTLDRLVRMHDAILGDRMDQEPIDSA